MTAVTVLRHVAFEDSGILEELFKQRGWKVTYVEAPVADWKKFDALKPDLLVVLGGPIGVYEENIYPFLTPEIAAIKKRLDADKPTLGICLGAQLIARAWRQRLSRPRKRNRLAAAAVVRGWPDLAAASSRGPARLHVSLARRYLRFAGGCHAAGGH